MKLLSLSTAETGCSIAISDDRQLICEEFWNSKLTHSRRVLEMIDHLLKKRAGMLPNDIDGFVSAKGPGSFTGVRIGISVIKGMAAGLDKPAVGVSSLDGIAFRLKYSSLPICVMMDARRKEVYHALYQFDQGRLVSKTKEIVAPPEEVAKEMPEKVIYTGSGSMVYQKLIADTVTEPIMVQPLKTHISAAALIEAFLDTGIDLNNQRASLEPVYIRKSDAQLKFG